MKRYILFLPLVFTLSFAYSQDENVAEADSLLAFQDEKNAVLAQRADSIRLADSLEQQNILEQISNLQAEDQGEKKKLELRLDSIKRAKSERDNRIKLEIAALKENTKPVPVLFFKDTLFQIYSKIGPLSAKDRAKIIQNKLEELVNKDLYDPALLKFETFEESSDIIHDEVIIMSVTDRDAFWAEKERVLLAQEYLDLINNSVLDYQSSTSVFHMLKRIGLLIIVLLVFFFGIKYLNKGFTWLNLQIIAKSKRFIKGIKFKNYEFLSEEREEQLLVWVLKALKWLVIVLVVYLALPVIFSIFPSTKSIANTMFGYVTKPIKKFGSELIGYIPELITIIVIVLVTRYFLRFLKFLASEVESGKLQIPGFYADWSKPTFNILKIIIYAFAFIVIFPYLPGSDSPVFQGVSVFLGVLFSLGSSSAIGNIIAGLVITYMRAFKIGDRVKIGDTVGDVIEKTMLVTRVRTIKNEDVTIPNMAILNGNTINYTTSAKTLGLILNTTVTIGYDVPWRKVHQLLIDSALKTDMIQDKPQPFVLQTSLDDFYVSYQINAYTENSGKAAVIYSQLHSNIQDAFNDAGVEILSPHYRADRDGNHVTIPSDYLPPNYNAPSFNVNVRKDEGS